MQLIEAALAFAITMLALSMICSSIVEMIHRALKMREDGLEYMLGQLFDQVLKKYLKPMAEMLSKTPEFQGKTIQDAFDTLRDSFLKQMTANRAPMGLKPDPELAHEPDADAKAPGLKPGNLWGGRRVTSLTTADFMERLGSIDVGAEISKAATATGTAAANDLDIILKDIAQKFEGFGKDAAVYFEGRARFMSVIVAIVVAFLVHADAIDLFRTYLRDPNARAEVIKQSEAVTAQFKATREVVDALQKESDEAKKKASAEAAMAPAADAQTPAGNAQASDAQKDREQQQKKENDIKDRVEKLRQDALDSIANANATVKQFADLGIPLGWDETRIEAAKMLHVIWTCKDADGNDSGLTSIWGRCYRSPTPVDATAKKAPQGAAKTEAAATGGAADEKAAAAKKLDERNEREARVVWLQIPTAISVIIYLIFGGLLIGLGAPFWYNAVTGLTNIRNTAKGLTDPAPPPKGVMVVAPRSAQPATPVDVFKVSNNA